MTLRYYLAAIALAVATGVLLWRLMRPFDVPPLFTPGTLSGGRGV